jgi:peptidoglycan/xylan/chitin deacetylase (PgdA/CDA1 family)
MKLQDRLLAQAAKAASAALALRVGPRLNVLIFHRVLPSPDPLFPGEVDAARFERQMSMVAKAFQVLPLAMAARHLAQGSLPNRALAITFDDGYADNETIAMPILRRLRLPATFFVATGFLDGGRMWNDSVIECLRNTKKDSLDLTELGLGVVACSGLVERQAAIRKVIVAIKHKDLVARDAAVALLVKACGSPALSNRLMMTRSQVQSLHTVGMDIGAHTVNHPILRSLPDPAARQEIAEGRQVLRDLTGAEVRSLAYPNGRPDEDYDKRHTAMAKELGFELAVTTSKGVASEGDDLFQVPRFTPWDTDVRRWLARLTANQTQARFNVAQTAAVA